MTKRIFKTLAALTLLLLLGSASAIAVPYQFTGEITDDFGNSFGVGLFDSISGIMVFPDGVIAGVPAPGEDYFLSDVGATLDFFVGDLQLSEEDDDFAQAFFTDGLLTGFEYQALFTFGNEEFEFFMIGSGEGETAFTIFEGWDGLGNEVLLGNFTSLPAAPVPEPVTMILVGTGLIGLVGARKKLKMS